MKLHGAVGAADAAALEGRARPQPCPSRRLCELPQQRPTPRHGQRGSYRRRLRFWQKMNHESCWNSFSVHSTFDARLSCCSHVNTSRRVQASCVCLCLSCDGHLRACMRKFKYLYIFKDWTPVFSSKSLSAPKLAVIFHCKVWTFSFSFPLQMLFSAAQTVTEKGWTVAVPESGTARGAEQFKQYFSIWWKAKKKMVKINASVTM